jgi:hypothetical protein
MNHTRRILPLLVAIAILISTVPVAYAATFPGPNNWSNVGSIDLTFSFSGNSALCDGVVTGLPSTTTISATFKLERKPSGGTYSSYHTWSQASTNSGTLRWSGSCSVSQGYTYKLSVTANVTRGGTTETVSTFVERSY